MNQSSQTSSDLFRRVEPHSSKGHVREPCRLFTLGRSILGGPSCSVLRAPSAVEGERGQGSNLLPGTTRHPAQCFRPTGGRNLPETPLTTYSLGLTAAFQTDDPDDLNTLGQKAFKPRWTRNVRTGGATTPYHAASESLQAVPQFTRCMARRQLRLGTVSALAARL